VSEVGDKLGQVRKPRLPGLALLEPFQSFRDAHDLPHEETREAAHDRPNRRPPKPDGSVAEPIIEKTDDERL
jgi:hypothetical protein